MRLQNLLLSSTIPAFLAFAALGLVELAGSETLAWRVSSGLAAAAFTVALVVVWGAKNKLPEDQRQMLNLRMFPVILGTIAVNVIVQLASAIGLFAVDAYAVFYFGLIAMLALGTYQFVRALLENVRSHARR